MMKKLLALMFFILPLCACIGGDNNGYPSRITFNKGGGIRKVYGREPNHILEITDYNGDGKASTEYPGDSMIVTYKWLTVKARQHDCDITIIAEPNTTGKGRKLYIGAWSGDDLAEIKVCQ